jgi:hypothetical protein
MHTCHLALFGYERASITVAWSLRRRGHLGGCGEVVLVASQGAIEEKPADEGVQAGCDVGAAPDPAVEPGGWVVGSSRLMPPVSRTRLTRARVSSRSWRCLMSRRHAAVGVRTVASSAPVTVRNSPSRRTSATRMAASMLSRMRAPTWPISQASRRRWWRTARWTGRLQPGRSAEANCELHCRSETILILLHGPLAARVA